MIRFEQVEKRYGAHPALTDFSLHIPKGQIVGLLGQNGAGKTTAMNILTGCLSPTSGRVLINGCDVQLESESAKRQIGYLPENAPLYDEMTVDHYLAFICRLRKMREKEIAGHIAALAEQTGVQEAMHRRIGNLSRGFRQRTAFAGALCASPAVIVLDEPTQGLDPLQAAEFRRLVRRLGKDRTVLFSSHILHDIEQVCDRAVILHQGKIMADQMLHTKKQRTLDCVIMMGEGKLLPALRSLHALESMQLLPDHEKGQTHLLLTARENAPLERELFTLLSVLDAPILRLCPASDSLEDMFLRVTQ